jgi:FkbM family methyltransferase
MFKRLSALTRPYRWLHRMISRGAWDPAEFPFAQLHFSQFGEDCVLRSLFGNCADGFYVDVGAFHPVFFSNTHQLYNAGWRGINIEPNPGQFPFFEQSRPRDINLNLAVSSSPETVDFVCDGPYSGINDDHYIARPGSGTQPVVKVGALPLSTILAEHLPVGCSVDLLSVDCEGHDLAVLQSNDWVACRPRVVMVEDHAPTVRSEITDFMGGENYRFYCRVGLTKIFLEAAFARQQMLDP